MQIAGDLRRCTETIDRLVVVAAASTPGSLQRHALAFPLIASVSARDMRSASATLADGLPLDLLVVEPDRYASELLYATGSPDHLRDLERVARDRALVLGPAGLARASGERLAAAGEPDLYRQMGMPYIPPELREGSGEVRGGPQAAPCPTISSRSDDLRGLRALPHGLLGWQAHRSRRWRAPRMRWACGYLTITDHSPSAFYAGGLDLDRLKAQWDEIARVQELVSVRLLRGTESDIQADGSLDYPDKILEQMDVVIASVHARHRMDADRMTRRLVQAMQHPCFKIWGHALGRLVLSRPPIECRIEDVLDAAAASRVAIEINGDPHRLDLEPRLIRAARERGLRFVISVDAHSVADLANQRYGVAMARRGWVRRGDVLNTLDRAGLRARGVAGRPPVRRVFLLSPAHCGGERARLLVNPQARFDLARRLREGPAPTLGEVFTFMSGLYFRGKIDIRSRLRRAPAPRARRLGDHDERWPVRRRGGRGHRAPPALCRDGHHADDARYAAPLLRDARLLARALDPGDEVVLLGSVATGKYVDPLLGVFGGSLRFPSAFVGRGDMSRGGLLLRSAAAGLELEYVSVGGRGAAWTPTAATRAAAMRARASARRRSATASETPSSPPAPGSRPAPAGPQTDRLIPRDQDTVEVRAGRRAVTLTHLRKMFWPELGLTKGDLLQYYVDVAPVLLPHLADRAMVMKRYPDGAAGAVLLHEARAVTPAGLDRDLRHRARLRQRDRLPDRAGSALAPLGGQPRLHRPEPVVRPLRRRRPSRLPALRPRSREGHAFRQGARDALVLREALDGMGMPSYPKTTGSKGIHVYVPIVRGPTQKEVWDVAKAIAQALEPARPALITAEYRDRATARRSRARRLQPERVGPNAGLHLLGAPASPRLRVGARDVGRGRARLRRSTTSASTTSPPASASVGDLWKPMLAARGRFRLDRLG